MASFLMCLTTSCLTDPKEVGNHKQHWRYDHEKRGMHTYMVYIYIYLYLSLSLYNIIYIYIIYICIIYRHIKINKHIYWNKTDRKTSASWLVYCTRRCAFNHKATIAARKEDNRNNDAPWREVSANKHPLVSRDLLAGHTFLSGAAKTHFHFLDFLALTPTPPPAVLLWSG